MVAHIRRATYQEIPSLVRPMVCAFAGKIRYRSELRSYAIERGEGGEAITPKRDTGEFVYVLPGGKTLTVTSDGRHWVFNGVRLEEQWPTPTQRVMVCGEHTFRVKPEDDTLLFSVTGAEPDMEAAIIGFFAYQGHQNDVMLIGLG